MKLKSHKSLSLTNGTHESGVFREEARRKSRSNSKHRERKWRKAQVELKRVNKHNGESQGRREPAVQKLRILIERGFFEVR